MWEAFRIIGLIFLGTILVPVTAMGLINLALFWLKPEYDPDDTGEYDFLGEEETTQEFLRAA